VWHPYGPMPGTTTPLVVESAAGVRLRLAEPVSRVRDLIYTMPPYVTSDEDLALICRGVLAAVEAAS